MDGLKCQKEILNQGLVGEILNDFMEINFGGKPRMSTVLLKSADVLVTMDAERREISDGWLLFEGGSIRAVGGDSDGSGLPGADAIIDASGCIVTPGLVNTHHHLYQNLTRTIAQDALLFGWLQTLYPIWAQMGPY